MPRILVKDIIVDHEFNSREEFSLDSIRDLAESIQQNGLIQPVVVRPWEDKYQLIAGFRRFTAVTRILKWNRIDAIVKKDLSEQQARVLNLEENLERRGLNMLEEARGIANAFKEMSAREIARVLRKPDRWVRVRLWLLEMPEHVQRLAAEGLISMKNLEVIHSLPSVEDQINAADVISGAKSCCRTDFQALIDERYRHTFVYRKSKEQIREKIKHMYKRGLEGGMPRTLGWVLGLVTDDELEKEIDDLKCCGNCKKYVENRNCYNMRPGSYCPGWLPDGLTRKDRE